MSEVSAVWRLLPKFGKLLQHHPVQIHCKRWMGLNIHSFRIKGFCCATVTPFKENGDLDLDIIPSYIQHLTDFGVSNVFANGTTGEAHSLTVEERKQTSEAFVKEAKGKMSAVILQVGAGNLRESQELASYAQDVGADAIACVGPTYFKPDTLDGYVEYMRQVAAAAPKLPFYLYDINFITGIKFEVNDFFHLAKDRIPTLRGIKHTTPDFLSITTILMDHGDRFQVMLGFDVLFLEGLAIGIDTVVMPSFSGLTLGRLQRAFENGDLVTARKEMNRLIAVNKIVRKAGFSIPGFCKAVLAAMGFETGPVRLPCSPVTREQVDTLKKNLTEIGFFDWAYQK